MSETISSGSGLVAWWRSNAELPSAEMRQTMRRAVRTAAGADWRQINRSFVVPAADDEARAAVVAKAIDATSDPLHRDWLLTLVLAELDPAQAAPILARALRLLVGAMLPGTPRWRRTIDLAAQWAGRGGASAEAEAANRAGDIPPLVAAAPAPPAAEAPITHRVLDTLAAPRDDMAATLRPYQALVDGLPLIGSARDVADIAGRLRAEFPWFEALIASVEAEWYFARAVGRGWTHLRPRLLHGPPGVGKSRFVRRLAELSGAKHAYLSASGSTDNRALAGTAAGWSTAAPSWPAAKMLQLGCANPMFLIDEIDKTSGSRRNGRIVDTLLTMIEPATATAWPDDCLGGNLDLSRASWLLCANDLAEVDRTLLGRVEAVAIGVPGAGHFDGLLSQIFTDIARDFAANPALLPQLSPHVVASLRSAFARTPSLRGLRRAVETALGLQSRIDAQRLH